MHTSNPSL